MSESQQVTTQPEEVKAPQQSGAVPSESADDKVVESTEKQVEAPKSTEQVVPESQSEPEPEPQTEQATEQQQPTVSEPAEEKATSVEKVAESDTKALDGKEEPEAEQAEELKEAKGATPVVASADEKETPAVESKVLEANGEAVEQTTDHQQPQSEETNGVSKRKADAGADAVDEEKSPKKAKVVDEGDQSAPAVEERAA